MTVIVKPFNCESIQVLLLWIVLNAKEILDKIGYKMLSKVKVKASLNCIVSRIHKDWWFEFQLNL